MRFLKYLFFFVLISGTALANPMLEEPPNNVEVKTKQNSIHGEIAFGQKQYDEESNPVDKDTDGEDGDINEDLDGNDDSIPMHTSSQTIAQNINYDNRPQQSPFVEDVPHPTQSHYPDPRFAQPRTCGENQYLCQKATPNQEHVRCIPNEWLCNQIRECELNDDELNCPANTDRQMDVYGPCPSDEYKCYGTGENNRPLHCIKRTDICNGVQDCPYNDDERDCEQRKDNKMYGSNNDFERTSEIASAPSILTHSLSVPAHTPCPPVEPRTDCPKSTYDTQHVKKLEWFNTCVKSCFQKTLY